MGPLYSRSTGRTRSSDRPTVVGWFVGSLGGIRTPAVDAAVATLGGLGNSGTQSCPLFGTTVPFSAEQLVALYGDHRGFVSAWSLATHDAVRAGFLRPADAGHLLTVAAQSDFLT